MDNEKFRPITKVSAFLAIVAVMLFEFVFALILGYSVLQYLSAVMDLAQLPPAPVTPPAPA